MIKLVYLVPLLPLAGFLVSGLGRNYLSKSLTGLITCGTVLISFVLSVLIFLEVRQPEFAGTVISGWDFIRVGKVNISFSFLVDQLSVLFLLIITGVGFLIHLYSTAYMHEETAPGYARYFAYLNLFIFFMLMLVLGANYVIMFIGWEGVGLCSYLLIGYWFKNEEFNKAANKAFIMNRIGDLGFLLAIFWMLFQFGTTSFSDVFGQASHATPVVITGITLLLFVGATGKSAQIPLFTWLPDAMAGPTPVSALIHAATMVTAGIYMVARSHVIYSMAPVTQQVVTMVGLATALLAASIALRQNDIKKVLAYSTVSQLGYMFLGLGVGAYTGAVFHVMTHAFFKALLFLGAGSVIHALHHEQDLRQMGGLKKFLPVTHITFLFGCIAIAGIPGFSGFFSKDEILMAAYQQNPILYYLGLGGALMTAFYMFRLYYLAFHGNYRGGESKTGSIHESPRAMTVPLIILGILSVLGGYVGMPGWLNHLLGSSHWLDHYLEPVLKTGGPDEITSHISVQTEYLLLGISTLLILASIFLARSRYRDYRGEKTGPFSRLLEHKWYVDELYDAIINRPLRSLSLFLNKVIEKMGIDGIVNGVGRLVNYGGRQLRLLQTGQVGSYILIMVIMTILFFIIQIFRTGS